MRDLPRFRDLRAFLSYLELNRQLVRVQAPVSTVHEMTEIHRRTLCAGGPALYFERAVRADGCASDIPVVVNLFGSAERVAWGLGVEFDDLRALGKKMAALRDMRPVDGVSGVLGRWPLLKAAYATMPVTVARAPVQQRIYRGAEIDLSTLPIQTCWPDEPAPLITWPLVITKPPGEETSRDVNMGVYRMQVLGSKRAIMRWLPHRGGAAHHRRWAATGQDMPIAVVIGADPATMLSAVLPLPEGISELGFSGVLRGERPRLTQCLSVPLMVPADAEIVIEGFVSASETAPEGPYGDHTGYYNSVADFPVMEVTAITKRESPLYVSTFTGRPPDEPSVIGTVLNELFVPVLRSQLPEVVDCWFPPDACSYRIAIVSIRKSYAGQARRIMMGLWGMLPQFSYTKLIIVVDDDINVRDWADVSWALATRMDPSRDAMHVHNTPIDYLDFASPAEGLGGKLGLDATNKMGSETTREWGRKLGMDTAVTQRVDALWHELDLGLHPGAGSGAGAA
ncbi:MAG TPA: UbiD family decarboxylase [Hyphomicrobium sp.]|nr:UbiD family decarboxylase [Hyphomicrobium sp.]